MAEMKITATGSSVDGFLNKLDDEQRIDSKVLVALMHEISGAESIMRSSSIVGFGDLQYKTPLLVKSTTVPRLASLRGKVNYRCI